ncbi:DUF1707 SHOCT-like domain-containing protein [Antrihabitans cavernicola]|uniref:DUF1707 domain-containing protein n=1 Tax=Antrihabitans cavernicola TaxID=2495913 RepID=A0A5A7S8G8_9NOCA|nr:DUF1707 domain-containing protein [Spelaeibacter cavernicola]KAA0018474.1 DUF1707 domain-containing protein [Spelaeibacter cavernicola]
MATTAPRLRARDIDRATVASALDQAYADGQLSFDEHRARIATAQSAKTLGELHAMVADLQSPVDLPEPTPLPRPRRARWVVIAGATAAVAVIAIVVATMWPDATTVEAVDPAPTTIAPTNTVAVAPAAVVPIVAPPVVLDSAEGVQRFIDQYRARFRDTVADQIVLYPKSKPPYGYVTREVAPGTQQNYNFRGGFDLSGPQSARQPDVQAVDLATIDVQVLAATMGAAPAILGAPTGAISHVMIENDGTPEMRFYVSDGVRSGYLTTTFTGEQLALYPVN